MTPAELGMMTTEMMTSAEIERELAALVQRLEVMADRLEDAQRFSDAHRLNAAIGYAEAVRRTLHDEGGAEHTGGQDDER